MLYHRANRRRRIKSLLLINTTRQYWLGPAWTYNWLPSYASKSTFIYPKFTHFISTAQHCAMWGHVGRVVKALDSKSIGLCPRRFKVSVKNIRLKLAVNNISNKITKQSCTWRNFLKFFIFTTLDLAALNFSFFWFYTDSVSRLIKGSILIGKYRSNDFHFLFS